MRASVNAHTRAHTQNPNEFEVRFTPDATYTGYRLIMKDAEFFALEADADTGIAMPVNGRYVTLTNSAYPESPAQTCFVMQHLSHKPFTLFVN